MWRAKAAKDYTVSDPVPYIDLTHQFNAEFGDVLCVQYYRKQNRFEIQYRKRCIDRITADDVVMGKMKILWRVFAQRRYRLKIKSKTPL